MLRLTAYLILTAFTVNVTADSQCLKGKASCGNAENRALVNGVWKCCYVGFIQALGDECNCSTTVKGNRVEPGSSQCPLEKEMQQLVNSMRRGLTDANAAFQNLIKEFIKIPNHRMEMETQLRDFKNSLEDKIDKLVDLSQKIFSKC